MKPINLFLSLITLLGGAKATGINRYVNASLEFILIPPGFVPPGAQCAGSFVEPNSLVVPKATGPLEATSYVFAYDTGFALSETSTMTSMAGIWVNRSLAVGEHLDVSVPPANDTNDRCGTFLQQFSGGAGADGCLLFEKNATCLHFWLEAPVIMPAVRPIENGTAQ